MIKLKKQQTIQKQEIQTERKSRKGSGDAVKKLARSGITAALYAVLTIVLQPISYGAVQCRVSEIFTLLPVFSSSSIPGLAVGCFAANIFSTVSPLDMIFGTAATIIAAILTRAFKNKRIFGIPLLSMLMPVIVNGLIIGAEITFFTDAAAGLTAFLASAGSVAAGELIPCVVLGIPFYQIIQKTRLKTILCD